METLVYTITAWKGCGRKIENKKRQQQSYNVETGLFEQYGSGGEARGEPEKNPQVNINRVGVEKRGQKEKIPQER